MRAIRWVALGICAMAAASTLFDRQTANLLKPSVEVVGRLLSHVVYAGLLYWNTRPRMGDGYKAWALALQIALGIPTASNTSELTMITIALAVPPGRRRPWVLAFIPSSVLGILLEFARDWSAIRPQLAALDPLGATVLLCTQMLVFAGWSMLAFYAVSLLVQSEIDRKRLSAMNSELLAMQEILRESGRFEERLRISRELHDSIGHHLTSQRILLELAAHHSVEPGKQHTERARLLARLMLSEIRDAVNSWQEERSTALSPAIRQLADGVVGIQVMCEIDDELPVTSPTVTHSLFRCAQEAVTNALRHADACHLWLSLKSHEGEIRLEIRDDGRGCETVKAGSGLSGIRARAAEVKGQLTIESSLGQGFRMLIVVPAESWSAA